MAISLKVGAKRVAHAGARLLGNNIEAYENTIPAMLSDRLRNPKFSGPENMQTGIAAEWEPAGNTMAAFSARLVSGAYLSGREAQLLHGYREGAWVSILQHGVRVRKGERFTVELWARAQHRPAQLRVELRLPGRATLPQCRGEVTVDLAHWQRRTCEIAAPGDGLAYFVVSVSPESRVMLDQIHLRPQGQGHVSPEFLTSFDHFPCSVLRFPGGCVSCAYHWQHGIGPVHLRPVCDDPVFKYKLHYDFGTDEYLELCVARKMTPLITLNTTTATPEDAADWAAYVRAWYTTRRLPVPAAYFMVGNENYGVWELGHMSGPMYVAQLREFVPAVRAAYPEARIMALGQESAGGLRDAYKTSWRELVIKEAADLFDILAVTRYAHGHDGAEMSAIMQGVADSVADKAADLEWQVRALREAGLQRKIAIVEWNFWTRASHNDHAGFREPNDIRHCLYAAGYLNAFCRHGDMIETANYYSLVNTMGMLQVHDGTVEITDVAKVFNLYADALPGEVLETAIDAPALTAQSKAVDVNVIRTRKAIYVFLVNYDALKSHTVTLTGVGAARAAQGLRASAILTPVREFKPRCSAGKVILPPMSLVRLTCAPK